MGVIIAFLVWLWILGINDWSFRAHDFLQSKGFLKNLRLLNGFARKAVYQKAPMCH